MKRRSARADALLQVRPGALSTDLAPVQSTDHVVTSDSQRPQRLTGLGSAETWDNTATIRLGISGLFPLSRRSTVLPPRSSSFLHYLPLGPLRKGPWLVPSVSGCPCRNTLSESRPHKPFLDPGIKREHTTVCGETHLFFFSPNTTRKDEQTRGLAPGRRQG